jgi:hypothetical protein
MIGVVERKKGVSSRESRPPRTSWASGASRRSERHQELSRANKVKPLFPHKQVGIVEREKAVAITALFARKKVQRLGFFGMGALQ